ncbi:MAG: hypothetical protein HYY16_18875 [Planctomycetes bacterium]|nr:hypothetical protein [Planctomycetota bacterium]
MARRNAAIVRRPDDGRYVVQSPQEGRYYLLGEDERRVLSWLDGNESVEGLAIRFERETGERLEPGALEGLLVQFDRMGLLEGSRRAPAPPPRSSLLCLRFRVFDPARVLETAARLAWPAFTTAGVTIMGVTIAAGVWMFVVHGGALLAELGGRGWPALPGAAVALIGMALLHEMAHGVTCVRWGGSVREMGFMVLLFFLPCLYTNLSAAWMFPRRAHRVWVMAAGVFFEVFIWSLAVLALAVLRLPEPLRFAALCMVAASGADVLANFNPLIKLDGYYLLSDLLGVPNLRARAFSYVMARLTGTRPDGVTTRERIIFTFYAPLALAFTAFFMIGGGVALGFALGSRYGWGAALPAWGLIGYLGVRAAADLVGSARRAARENRRSR